MATALTIDEQINHFLVQLSPKQKKAVLGVIKIFAEEKETATAWSDDDIRQRWINGLQNMKAAN